MRLIYNIVLFMSISLYDLTCLFDGKNYATQVPTLYRLFFLSMVAQPFFGYIKLIWNRRPQSEV